MKVDNKEEVLICGAGAMGGSIGAIMKRSGYPVTLVDASSDHVSAIREKGLSLIGPIAEFNVDIPIFTPNELQGQWRIVFIAVKAQHTDAACRALTPHFAPDGGIVTLQNGFDAELISTHFGRERTFATIGGAGGDILEPGVIRYGGGHGNAAGQIDGHESALLDEMVAALQVYGPETFAVPNIQDYLWGKHCFNTITCSSAMALSPLAELLERDDVKRLWRDLIREVISVAQEHRVRPRGSGGFDPMAFAPGNPPEALKPFFDGLMAMSDKSRKPHSGMWRDLNVHKRKTEVDLLLSPIVALAEKYGVPTPLLRGVISLVGEIENGTRVSSDENLIELMGFGQRNFV